MGNITSHFRRFRNARRERSNLISPSIAKPDGWSFAVPANLECDKTFWEDDDKGRDHPFFGRMLPRLRAREWLRVNAEAACYPFRRTDLGEIITRSSPPLVEDPQDVAGFFDTLDGERMLSLEPEVSWNFVGRGNKYTVAAVFVRDPLFEENENFRTAALSYANAWLDHQCEEVKSLEHTTYRLLCISLGVSQAVCEDCGDYMALGLSYHRNDNKQILASHLTREKNGNVHRMDF